MTNAVARKGGLGLAKHAGGLVVMKRGTACVTTEELLASLDEHG